MIASSLSDFLADASPALHLGAAFIAPLLPDCRVASPPHTHPLLSRMPICLVSAGLPGNGHERFGALDWRGVGGRGKGRSRRGEQGEVEGKEMLRSERQRDSEADGCARGRGPGGARGDPKRRGHEGTNQFPQQLRG